MSACPLPPSPHLVSPIQAAAFATDGVLVIRNAIERDLVHDLHARASRIRQAVEATLPAGTRFAPRRGNDGGDRSAATTWGINEITRPAFFDPPLIDVIGHPLVRALLDRLLDQPRAWGQKLLWAPRSCDYILHWHRDVHDAFDGLMPFKPAADDHIQFNLALADDPSFRVVPGTHRRGLTAEETSALAADSCGPMPGEVHLPLAAGDLLLMNAHALHRGEVPAGGPRMTLHFSFQAQWVPLWPWTDAEEFARLESAAFRMCLDPAARPPYERLTSAERSPTQYAWLVEAARANGWSPTEGWTAPPSAA